MQLSFDSEKYVLLLCVWKVAFSNPVTFVYTYILHHFIMKGDDHEPGPYSFTIPAGETFFPVNISITDDDIVEGNETFILTIDEDSTQ